MERLVGLSEMVPDSWWRLSKNGFSFTYWLIRRSAWVIGTSMALLWFPAFIETQRLEMVAMQDLQTKQVRVRSTRNNFPILSIIRIYFVSMVAPPIINYFFPHR